MRTERELVSVVFSTGDAVFTASRHAMEYLLMSILSAMRNAVGANFRLREVYFRHRRPGKLDEAERAFGCPVYFGQPDDRHIFPLSALWAVPRFPNRSIAEQIQKTHRRVKRPHRGTRDDLRASGAGDTSTACFGVRGSSASVARRLGMTSRTLQRKLAEEGTNFRALRDAVLWEAVEVLLSNPSLKIEAIALSVGFSDVAAFSKAFRRWKGYPPTRYRETLAGSKKARPREAARRAMI